MVRAVPLPHVSASTDVLQDDLYLLRPHVPCAEQYSSAVKVKLSLNRKLRLPDLTTAQYGGRLSALRTGLLYPPGIFLVLIFSMG